MDVLEPLDHFINRWTKSQVSDQNEFQKIFDVLIVVNHVELVLRHKIFSMLNNFHEEVGPVRMVKKEFTGKKLEEYAAYRPDIAQSVCSNLLPSVILVVVFSCVDLKLEHFWGLDRISASISHTELIFFV